MNKRNGLLLLVFALVAVLVVLLIVAGSMAGSHTDPTNPTGGSLNSQPTNPSSPTQDSSEPTQSEPAPSTEPEPTESQPTEPQPTETQPTEPRPTNPGDEYIGTLYTRAELEAMDTKEMGYGPGVSKDGKRPEYAVSDQQRNEKYGANFIAPDNGNIYLTFDCGYEYTATAPDGSKYRVTEKILDVLKEKNVKAVFFVTMHYCEDQPDLVQRMIDEGHVVGNHTNNHPNMPQQTIDKMVYEIMSLHEYVQEHFGYTMTLFRPPEGAYSTQSLALTQSLGYKTVHWSFAYADYDTSNQMEPAKALERVTSSAHSGAIYLLHAISTTNASILSDAIDSFRAQGYHIELFY